jgi:hypothetical protein
LFYSTEKSFQLVLQYVLPIILIVAIIGNDSCEITPRPVHFEHRQKVFMLQPENALNIYVENNIILRFAAWESANG